MTKYCQVKVYVVNSSNFCSKCFNKMCTDSNLFWNRCTFTGTHLQLIKSSTSITIFMTPQAIVMLSQVLN